MHGVLTQQSQGAFPPVQDIVLLSIEGMRCTVGVGHLQVCALDLDGIDFPAVAQFYLRLTGRVDGRYPARPGPVHRVGTLSVMAWSSIMRRTSCVVPIFKYVETSLMFASPRMICSRRKRRRSACGSSRVFSRGRPDMVLMLNTVSQKSARWESLITGMSP